MRILLDECLPRDLARELIGHEVRAVPAAGWAGISNGRLLGLIATSGKCDVFVTVDKRLPTHPHQGSADGFKLFAASDDHVARREEWLRRRPFARLRTLHRRRDRGSGQGNASGCSSPDGDGSRGADSPPGRPIPGLFPRRIRPLVRPVDPRTSEPPQPHRAPPQGETRPASSWSERCADSRLHFLQGQGRRRALLMLGQTLGDQRYVIG